MSNPQQPNNHAFQAGFSKAKDEYEAGYKAAIGHHHGAPIAPGQQQPGLDQQQQPGLGQQQPGLGQQQHPAFDQQQQGLGQSALDQQPGYGQQQTGYGQPQTGYGQPQMGNPTAGNMQQAGGNGMNSDVQGNAYQQHKHDLNQDPGAGGAMGGVRQQAYDEHKRHLDQNPSAAGGVGGVQQQAYDEHKDHLDRNQNAGTDRMAGGPGAGITGGNLNNQLEQEAAVHSGPPHGLGNKIKSKLPHHFNDGTKVPRELREDVSGQNGPGPM
ncbi:hypothetical protein K450DRAFT_257637 [Umbelopsis ramanniana AG]|uniref:Uncharacterized protein n=1 Tax=Umbelopsis ramanniana AG TaxID=1314678 RepID=A0AAD5E3Z9_UMBRA|nr:uncharacterized protein K450DRAFT_257637 [Umbelopsis ramanniana AG]KAI8576309.1 hypothetical protein K450DRAFT_257637 [Umbelopsis ramanniana AG]